MLDVSLTLPGVNVTFPAGTHTAIVGPASPGASTLLRFIAGTRRPESGEIRIGSRIVNDLRASQRPLLFVTSTLEVPERWSVRHALVAAVRHRTLDRVDRQHEYALAVEKWKLSALIDRKIRTLSQSERTLVNVARIELLRPGILLADRVLERLNAAGSETIIDSFYRTLRVAGTTVITVPSTRAELGVTDRIIVLKEGRIVQEGTVAHVYVQPSGIASAQATGDVNVVPVTIRGSEVESGIGNWTLAAPRFQGAGFALARPEHFTLADSGEESDLIVAVEEATFENGRWLIRAILGGNTMLRVSLPAEIRLHKGKLLALKYDPSRFAMAGAAV